MKTNTSRYALLGMLGIRPMSGYDIKQAIGESIAFFWDESYGRIYPTLQQLATEGLAARKTERHNGRPDRQIYSLTPQGLKELERWLALPVREQKPRSELLLKLFFGRHLPAQEHVRHLEQVRQQHRQLLASCRALEKEVKVQAGNHPDRRYWLITIRFGQHRSRAIVQWCDETIRLLAREARGGRAHPGAQSKTRRNP
jgi:DNA-binding PadR family transcriptional regulator